MNRSAASLAPHVDRLVVAVHHGMGERHEEVHALVAETGIPGPALLIDLRPFVVVEARIPIGVVDGFLRFVPPGRAGAIRHELNAGGHLVVHGDVAEVSAAVRRFAVGATKLQVEVTRALWHGDLPTVRSILPIAGAVVAEARSIAVELPLFGPLAGLAEPEEGQAYLLHHRLTLLRYLRSDLHVAELAAEGLAPPAAQVVDALWQGHQPPGTYDVPEGWVAADGTALTADGRRRRALVEERTNERMDGLLASVDAPAFVGSLSRLSS